MKQKILTLLNERRDLSWLNTAYTFIESDETNLLSEQAGHHTVCDLLAEICIRSQSAQKAGITPTGITELKERLEELSADRIVENYIFKGQGKVAIVYLDKKSETILGAIMVCTSLA